MQRTRKPAQIVRRYFSTSIDYDAKNDAYKILEVSDNMATQDIKKAYYKLAHKYHPDKAGEKYADKFKQISAAWEVLSDAEARRQYDEARRMSSDNQSQQFRSQNTSSGYSHKENKAGKSDNYYGDFESKDDFYGFYSTFNKSKSSQKQTHGSEQSKSSFNSKKDFYGTHSAHKSQPNEDAKYYKQQSQSEQNNKQQHYKYSEQQYDNNTYYRPPDPNEQFTSTEEKDRFYEFYEENVNFDKDAKSNWNSFKKQRHKVQSDEERRYERAQKYGQYDPTEDSNFHQKNRGYAQKDLSKSWSAYFRGFYYQMFDIKDFNQEFRQTHYTDAQFEDAKKWFDSQTHESMTRKPIQNKDAFKMMKPVRVLCGVFFLVGVKHGVDWFVK